LLAVVACLWGCAQSSTGRADHITYDIYSGGVSGTKEAEYQVSSFLVAGTRLDPFTPTFLISGLSSPGQLIGGFSDFGGVMLATIEYDDMSVGSLLARFSSSQFPTSPGTYTLASTSAGSDDMGMLLPTPDTVVISESGPTTTPEPSTLALMGGVGLGLLGYLWQKRQRAA
jgi:hypothetical protein